MRSLVVWVVVVACSLQPACMGTPDAAAAPATSAPTVKLLGAGKGPKKQLRFTARKGMKKTLTMTMKMSMTMMFGGTPTTTTVPPIQVPLAMRITDVAKNGDIRYEFEVLEPQVVADAAMAPGTIEAMKQAMAGLSGLSGTAVVSNRGFTLDADVEVPADANPQLLQLVDSIRQSIRQMSAPVPKEAVGVGAKWVTTFKLAQRGMKLVQVATTELVALEGNVMTLKITLAQSAPKQKMTANGLTFDLDSYKGSGTGESTMDLGQLVPIEANVMMKSDLQMKSGAQAIGMSIDLAMTVASQ